MRPSLPSSGGFHDRRLETRTLASVAISGLPLC
jgi:hypothetical protein